MWGHPAFQKNLATLKEFGHCIISPQTGTLACGEEGMGKLADIEDIYDGIVALGSTASEVFEGKNVLVTAGPTFEDLDPVRTFTNRASGRMGIEMAKAFRNAGAKVHLVLGGNMPAPWDISTTRVRSAQEMFDACMSLWPDMDGACAAAAVADQRPAHPSTQKAKKAEASETLQLAKTPDILAALNESKARQWLLGFAAESENVVKNATEKLYKKGLDAILANDVSHGKGFGNQTNCLIPITKDGSHAPIGPAPKEQLATDTVQWFANCLESK
jgi:phosphopantothenoylcysteine decarboxylase/phosphopantothenate--cysteine ligase